MGHCKFWITLGGESLQILTLTPTLFILVQGVELVGSTTEEALAKLKEETVIWGKVIRDKNIKPE